MKSLRVFSTKFITILFGSVLASMAWAGEDTLSYSALEKMETGIMTITTRIYVSGKKQRRETQSGAGKSIQIIRPDKGALWMLMPSQRMYMAMSMDGQGSPKNNKSSQLDIMEKKKVGEETINGMKTTKYKIIARNADGSKFGGFVWVTKNGLTVKMDAISKSEGRKVRIRRTLSDIKLGRQDPSLFEVPAGYRKFSMGGMSDMMRQRRSR